MVLGDLSNMREYEVKDQKNKSLDSALKEEEGAADKDASPDPRLFRKLRKGATSVMLPNEAADLVEAHIDRMIRLGIAIQGKDALLAPRWHAALHEAGHAVVATLEGLGVEAVSVKPEWFEGVKTWSGKTWTGVRSGKVGPATSLEQDAARLRYTLAGYVSEVCFTEDDFRLASSADETGIADIIAWTISAKTGEPPKKIYLDGCLYARAQLKHNADIVKTIAKKLMHARKLRGAPLQKLLAKVKKPNADSIRETLALAEKEVALHDILADQSKGRELMANSISYFG